MIFDPSHHLGVNTKCLVFNKNKRYCFNAAQIRPAAGKLSAIASSFFRSGWWGKRHPLEADLRVTNQRRLPTTPPVGALIVLNISRKSTLAWWERLLHFELSELFSIRDFPVIIVMWHFVWEFCRFCLVLFIWILLRVSLLTFFPRFTILSVSTQPAKKFKFLQNVTELGKLLTYLWRHSLVIIMLAQTANFKIKIRYEVWTIEFYINVIVK